MEMKDRFKRRHLIYYLRVFDRNTDNIIGHLIDITTEGVMLISEEPLETNSVYQLRMDLPSEIFQRKELIFDAKSIWCKKDVNPNYYNTGFRLQNCNPNDLEIIKQLIHQFGFEN